MATSTTNFNLIKPEYTDAADIEVLNENFQKIDEEMQKNANRLTVQGVSVAQESVVIFANPGSSPKRVVVGIYDMGVEFATGDTFDTIHTVDVTIGAYQAVPILVRNGCFSLENRAEDKKRSPSITLYKTFGGSGSPTKYLYSVDKCGVIIVESEYWCLTGDTLLTMADRSKKRIDLIEVGDEVLSIDWETRKLVPNRVSFTDKDDGKEWSEYDRWTFSDGTVIKTVHEHEFYNVENACMQYMSKWNIGDHAYRIDGESVSLVSRETVSETVRHYKITCEKGTNYFANGLLTGDRNCPKGIVLKNA